MGATVDFDEQKYSTGFHIEYENPLESYLETRRKDWGDDPIANRVQMVVDQQINPGVAGHGGWVVLLDVKDETAFIEMGGGCRGCGRRLPCRGAASSSRRPGCGARGSRGSSPRKCRKSSGCWIPQITPKAKIPITQKIPLPEALPFRLKIQEKMP